ncbi:MAG: RusA family crossover junction endodeoxyribonuclease [Chloroflexi bacterium]|nr:RusA family crossover junction endodeoxyribonuclease [Chloroflexota bacterium]
MEAVIIIPGRAFSGRSDSAALYKRRIYDAAGPLFSGPLTLHGIALRVDHFYATGHMIDLDNLLKCVLDGLTGAAYVDDAQVDEVLIRRYNVSTSHFVPSIRREWVEHITERREFVSIVVSSDEDVA